MRYRVGLVRRFTAIMILGLMLLPVLSSAVPLQNEKLVDTQVGEIPWWENTNMDGNNDYIHDAIWIASENNGYEYLDENNMISVIVDFDHTPTIEDEIMLEENVLFEVQFRYWLIDSIAGKNKEPNVTINLNIL